MRLRYRLPFRATKKLITISILLIFLYSYISPKSKKQDVKHRHVIKIQSQPESRRTTVEVDTKSSPIKFSSSKDPKKLSLKKIDWHKYYLKEHESQRAGSGEYGESALLPNQDKFEIDRLIKAYGFNTAISDKISLNRSLPDLRHPGCQKRLYLESLPSVSVIIIFHNEHWSTLLRTVFSVLNRSPDKLIKEIFLVDDASDKGSNLDDYVEKNVPKVKVVRLLSRGGVVGARLAGVKLATAEVLVFLDSHMEVNVNWLPPLLEPIVLDDQTSVVPIIDYIDHKDLSYHKLDDGARGGISFNGYFYVRIPMLPKDEENLPDPFATPVMNGGAFAITRRFFWKLGGYDTGLKIWGCEQFELSFKIWQCGGRLLEAPCSRIGHLYRNVKHPIPYPGYDDYFSKNIRRVANVWMDEYAKLIYKMLPPNVARHDPGDLKEQKSLRRKLKCKPFKWFITQVAFDLLQQYPFEEPLPYAEGQIRPKSSPHLCIDALNGQPGDTVTIQECNDSPEQKFVLSFHNDIQMWNRSSIYARAMCIGVVKPSMGAHVIMQKCHGHGGNQQWKYEDSRHLISKAVLCLDHDPGKLELFLSVCDYHSETQKWNIDVVRSEELGTWNAANSIWVTGPAEEWKDD